MVSMSICTVCPASLFPHYVKFVGNGYCMHRGKTLRRRHCVSKPLRINFCLNKGGSYVNSETRSTNLSETSEIVEVIGIGSRKHAVFNFCLDSPFQSSSLRFWNIIMKDSAEPQLHQRVLGEDVTPTILDAPFCAESYFKAIILVASAGYGLEHYTAVDICRNVRSAKGLVVGIILKPFSFEGQRRQNEVKDLVGELKQHTNICIVIDTDALLKKDMVTLDEALKTANNAVVLAINAISFLFSDMHKKFIDVPHNGMRELKVPEVLNILESYKEAKIGFGAAYNIRTSILRAIYDCPFLNVGLKDFNGVVICIVASSNVKNESDKESYLHAFRHATKCTKEIIMCIIHEPSAEPNGIVTTVIAASSMEQKMSQKDGILSKLAQRFPFVFDLWSRYKPQSAYPKEIVNKFSLSEVVDSPNDGETPNSSPLRSTSESFDDKLETLLRDEFDEDPELREYGQSEVKLSRTGTKSLDMYDLISKGRTAYQREPLISWNLGTENQITEDWADERVADSEDTPMLSSLIMYSLPVGVRRSEECSKLPDTNQQDEIDIYNTVASTVINGKDDHTQRKQGVLAVRAASMLEAERDPQKKWNRIVKMQYRGGIYRGHCQGGLPEGKGRLSLADGSIYDGMWRYGKRSGLGTFYLCNGDVFQGSWRDDIMHGKGWFYFHTGDRWFANFWKGKANGEGRFYSKSGDVFFGQFQDGWRHGRFLCINVDGVRFTESWEDGILVSRKQLDAEMDAGKISMYL